MDEKNEKLQELLGYLKKYNYIDTRSCNYSVLNFFKDEEKITEEEVFLCWGLIEEEIKKELPNVNIDLVKLHLFLNYIKIKSAKFIDFKKLYEDNNFIIVNGIIRNDYLKYNNNKLKELVKELYRYDNSLNITNMILAQGLECHGNSIKKTITYINDLNSIKVLNIKDNTFLTNIKLEKIKKTNIEKIEKALGLTLCDIRFDNGLTLIENANRNYFMWKSSELLKLNLKVFGHVFEEKILELCDYSLKDFTNTGKEKMLEIVNRKLEKVKVEKTRLFWLRVSFYLTEWETKEVVVKKVKKI